MANINIEIEMENGGVIKAELYPEVAPITVENFVKLIEDDFFAGLILLLTACIKRPTLSRVNLIQTV